ncbi:MAG: hypothetical protein ACLFV0_06720, partial [Nitriliruptoraceae bacterium]
MPVTTDPMIRAARTATTADLLAAAASAPRRHADPARRSSPQVVFDQPVERTVGRERLLARIEEELHGARSVTLRGRRGVGKSRLLAELHHRHVGPTHLLVGTDAAAGAVQVPTVRDRPGGDASLLLLIDDAQHLPGREIARIHALREQPWCRVVTAVASDANEAVSSSYGPWWRSSRWRSLEVTPLSRTATAELLAELLGGLAAPQLVRAVWQATGGHPVAVVELARDAYEQGAITPGTECWRQVAPLPVGRLTALVGDRFAGLTHEGWHDLAVLALAGPLPIRVAGRVLRPATVKELEARGLVRFGSSRAGRTLAIADAVHAEVVRAGLDAEVHDRLLREVADTLDRSGPGAGRELALARWRLEVGGWSPTQLASAAARARCAGATELAVSLADAAVRDGAGEDARRVRALASVELGASADAATAPEQEPVLHAQALAIGAGRWDEAIAHLERAHATAADEVTTRGYAAVLAVLGGQPTRAATLLEAGELGHLGAAAGALLAAARGDVDVLRQAAMQVRGCEDAHDLLPVGRDLVEGAVLLLDGEAHLDDRLDTAQQRVDRALGQTSAATAWWFAVEGWLRWQAGQLARARQRLTSALLACQDADPVRLRPLLLADLGVLAAFTGAAVEAQWRLSRIGEDRDTNAAVAHRCEVATALVAGHARGARPMVPVLAGAAHEAVRQGRAWDAAWTWRLAASVGEPGDLDVPAEALAGAVDQRESERAVG